MDYRTAAFRSLLSLHAESLIEGGHERLLQCYEVPLALYFEDNLCVLQSYAQLDAAFARHVANLREHDIYRLVPEITQTRGETAEGSRIAVAWQYHLRHTPAPRSTLTEYFVAWSGERPTVRMVTFQQFQPRSYRSEARAAA